MKSLQENHNHIRRVAVIGSGVAGLSAALLLKAAGVSVQVFEKSRGPGGRLASKRTSEGGVDIGAQYFTVRDQGFRDFLNQYAPGSFQPWRGNLQLERPPGQFQPFGEDTRYVGVPRMTAVSRALSEQLSSHYETRIHKLLKIDGADQWGLESAEGEQFGPFDQVIITAPPVQTRDLLINSGLGSLNQVPALADADMLPCWALGIRLSAALPVSYDGLQPAEGPIGWVARDSSKPGREVPHEWWMLHATPEWSAAHEGAEPDRVREVLISSFKGLHEVPEDVSVTETVVHRWLYARSPSTEAGAGHLWFAEQGIAVIGDWLAGGRVEGAYLSAAGLIQQWQSNQLVRTA